MNYKKEAGLNLLPINIQLFGIGGDITTSYYNTVQGTYPQGSFPTGKMVSIYVECSGDTCMYSGGEQEYTYVFQGISISSTTFSPPTSSYNFKSAITYDLGVSGSGGTYPFVYRYNLNTTQRNLINALTPGTYYVWYDGANRGVLTITSSSFTGTTTVTKNFVTTNKSGNNPIIISLNWLNPTTSTLYHYYSLSSIVIPSSGANTVHGWYGPYTCANNSSGSLNASIQYENVTTLTDGAALYLSSYVTTSSTWNAKTSGFNSTTAAAIYNTIGLKVRDVYFFFEDPNIGSIRAAWNQNITMPHYPGYNLINWSNLSRLGTATFRNGTNVSTNQINIAGAINSTTNNVYWFNMTGSNSTKNSYSITYRSALPDSSEYNWINGTASPYQISTTSNQTVAIPFPTYHGTKSAEFGEYTFNRYDVTRSGGNGGTLPYISANNLTIPVNSYGNIAIDAVWDYNKTGIAGTLSAINSGSHTDINGTTRSFNGYNYNFYNWTAPTTPISNITYTSTDDPAPEFGTFEAQSHPGYEFLTSSIISYPFASDGSISNVPYNILFVPTENIFNSTLPAPLWGNSGTTKYYYEISGLIGGNINVGIATSLFEHPIYVSMGSNISSFTFNNEVYTSAWPNKYTYNSKTYYKLNGATFNVKGIYSYPITNLVTTAGFYAPNYTISINSTGVNWTNDGILTNAFVDLAPATLVEYTVNTAIDPISIIDASITPTTYNATTNTFTPNITSINKVFGYNNVIISGYASNSGVNVITGLTNIATITKPSYNNYFYTVSATKQTYYINKNTSTPYGIGSYTLNKNTFEISSSKQGVSASYIMNDGYVMNTSNALSVGNFQNSTGSVFTGADQTYNTFNIPASTVGNVIFTAPNPDKIQYTITEGIITGINGINNISFIPNNYYISNSATKQTIMATIGLKPGYSQPTGLLTVVGSSTSNITNTSFNINTNGYGSITVTPNTPLLNTYDVIVNAINIPTRGFSGISSFVYSPMNFNVESLTFKPSITSITYTNEGFSGYQAEFTDTGEFAGSGSTTNNLFDIAQGTYRNRVFNIYALPVTFNIGITKDSSISTYNFAGNLFSTDANIRTYNVLSSDINVNIDNIVLTNQLYLPKANFTIGTVPTGSTGHKSFALSSSLKNNSITINALPNGYASSTLSDNFYIATASSSKAISLTHTMNAGWSQPTGNLTVSQVYNNTGSLVSVTNISNRSFIIPVSSWGDITIALPTPSVINYQLNISGVPSGVNSTNYGVFPTNYMATDTYPKTFNLNIRPLLGYENPTWSISGNVNSATSFVVDSFSTTVPVISVTGGSIITYNMNIVKGTGINTYKYGITTYNASSTVDTYNVLSTRSIALTDINVINSLWNPVANYTAISVEAGNTGDKSNTVSTTLKTSLININATLPTGIGSASVSSNNYQSVINTQTRTVNVSYVMNNGYSLPSNMTVTGSLNGANGAVTITPSNGNQFNIAPNTWGNLIVTPSAPNKITYNINTGTLPDGMGSISYTINSVAVSNYQILTTARTVSVVYTMNNGYAQPTGNLTVTSPGVVINNRAFSIPINAYGDITVTPNTITKLIYNINAGTLANGINTMTITPNTYSINHTNNISIALGYTANLGWSVPSGNPTIVGSNTNVLSSTAFNILTNGFGNITVTPSDPIANTYNVVIGNNPKPAAINQWSVSPTNYKVTDTYPKTFNITATAKTGYDIPTWSINGNINSAASFIMNPFTETLPNLQITSGNPITYPIGLNYSSTNSGITAATISPTSFNIETPTFTPVISGVTYAGGYSGYNVSPVIGAINLGSTGNRTYTIMGTPITYAITKVLGAGISSANLSKSTYNIHETPFTVAWSNIAYNTGYNGYTLSGDNLTVSAGTYGNRSYTITGNEITYTVTITKPASVVSFIYGGTTYTGESSQIDTFTITSSTKTITLTNIIYAEGYVGSPTIAFGTIPTGSTGNKTYSLSDVRNVYIDVYSYPTPLTTNHKITSFDYSGNTFTVNGREQVWIDYFVSTKSSLTILVDNIIYESGYTGPTSYNFGTINPATLVPFEDKTYSMNSTELITYTVTISKPANVVSFIYGGTTYTASSSQIDTYNITSANKVITLTDIIYNAGYTGSSSVEFGTISTGSIGNESYTIDSPTLITYTVTISKPANIVSYVYNSVTYTASSSQIDTFNVTSATKTITLTDIVYSNGYTGSNTSEFGTIPTGSIGNKSYTIDSPTLITYTVTISKPANVVSFIYGGTTYTTSSSQIDTFTVISLDKNILLTDIIYSAGYTGPTSTNFGTIITGSIGNKSYSVTAPTLITYTVTISKPANVVSFIYGGTTYTASSSQIDTYNVESANKTITLTAVTYTNGYTGSSLINFSTITTGSTGNKSYSINAPTLITYTVTVLKPTISGITSFKYNGVTYTASSSQIDTFNVTSADKSILITDIIYEEGYTGSTSVDFGTIPTGSTGNKQYELSVVNNVYINVYNYPTPLTENKKIISFKYNGNTFTVNGREQVWIDYFVETTPILTISLTDIIYEAGYTGPTSYNFGTINPAVVTDDVIFETSSTVLITYTVTISKPANIVSYVYNSVTYTASSSQIDTFNVTSADKNIALTSITYSAGYTGSNTSEFGTIPTGSIGNKSYTIDSPTLITYTVTISKPANIVSYVYNSVTYTASSSQIDTFNVTSATKTISLTSIVYATGYTGVSSVNFGTIPAGSTGNKSYSIDAPTLITYTVTVVKPANIVSYVYNSVTYTASSSQIDTFTVVSTSKTINITSIVYATGYTGVVSTTLGTINAGSSSNVSYTMTDPTLITYTVTVVKPANIVSYVYNSVTYTASSSQIDTFNVTSADKNIALTSITYSAGYTGVSSVNFGSITTGSINNRTYTIDSPTLITYNITISKPELTGVLSFKYGSTTYSSIESTIDTFTVVSSNKVITLTDLVYANGYVGSSTIAFGVIPTGSINNRSFSLADVNNIFVNVDSWTNGTTTHYKIQSFKYNGISHVVNGRNLIWVNYFVSATPTITSNVTEIIYEAGYTGPTSYNFGTINPAVATDDVTYTMNLTTLITYKVYIKKDSTIVSFKYNAGFLTGGAQTTISNNDTVEVSFNIQSQLDVSVYGIIYTTGYEGYNNGPTSNPVSISYDSTNFDRSSNIGSALNPLLVTYDKLTNYTITINKNDPSSKLTSFTQDIKYNVSLATVTGGIYTILSNNIDVTAENLVYITGTNTDGTWSLYTGPSSYGYDDGINLNWSVPSGSTGNKVFTIPVDLITQPNVFSITYTGKSKTANGYTSEINQVKDTYTYKTGTTINHGNVDSFTVVPNLVLPEISTRLAANTPIHYSYYMSSNSAGISVTNNGTLATISNVDFGDKVININWTEVVFKVVVKDHYIIKDVYGILADNTKVSPISGLTTDANVFEINYSLNSSNQNKIITNNIYNKTDITRTGWDFVNAKETNGSGIIEIVGPADDITGFTIPAAWYDNKEVRLVYTPKTYTISLGDGNSLWVVYDHEIQKWSPNNVPTSIDKIFNGFEDGNDVERISYGGIYNFTNSSYSTNVTFTPKWIDRNDFISYDATSNALIDSTQMENVTISSVIYSRFKESIVSPILVQNILIDSVIQSEPVSSNTKYIFNLLSGYIKFRKIDNMSVVKGYNTLTIVSSGLNTYLNNGANLQNNMIISMVDLINQLESGWSGANTTELSNIAISKPNDLWTTNRLASADVFRIMFKVSNSISGPFTYWIFDGLIRPSDMAITKQASSTKQDMFLINTSEGLKEVMKIKDKNNVVLYDRTPHILENNGILTNWEDSILGQAKTADVYGLLPVNKDKVYSMDISMKTSWKTEALNWNTGFTTVNLPHNTNVRLNELVEGVNTLNYGRIPIGSIYSNKISNMGNLTLNNVKNYMVVNDKLVITGLDTLLGAAANEKGALSSDGSFYIPTLYYTLLINNSKSSSLKTKTLNPSTKQYAYTPSNRNIGTYVVQGPVSDIDNNLRFLLSDSTGITNVYIGKLDSNLNTITSLITLTKEAGTNWYKLSNPFASLTSNNDYYTIVIETADKLMYNNLLIYKRFVS